MFEKIGMSIKMLIENILHAYPYITPRSLERILIGVIDEEMPPEQLAQEEPDAPTQECLADHM